MIKTSAKPKMDSRRVPMTGTTLSLPVIASGIQAAPAKATPKKTAKKNIAASLVASKRSSSPKGRLLWVGDAGTPTGFATVTHSVLEHLHPAWDVSVSGVNYDGAPHSFPYQIMPACQGGDMWGMDRFAHLCAEFAPDVVMINNDWWNVAAFMQRAPKTVPVVAYMPVDGANIDPAVIPHLEKLAAAIWYTDFGYREAVNAGFSGRREVIPHGLDSKLFHPMDRVRARQALNLPKDAFIVGNVNRNQPRKRLDLTIQYFAEWIRTRGIKNALLLLHCAKRDIGWDLQSLARYHGVENRVVFTGSDDLRDAVGTAELPLIYSALDVQVSTSLGEGWGLTTMEGMACGVPQIVPDWAALAEWATPAIKVPCPVQLAHPEISTIGALPDKVTFMEALQELYRHEEQRREISGHCLRFVRQPQFSWETVSREIDAVLEKAVRGGRTLRRPARV